MDSQRARFWVPLLFLFGCSSSPQIAKVDSGTKALPKELVSKFEVLEEAQPAASPTPAAALPAALSAPAVKIAAKVKAKAKVGKKEKSVEPFLIPDRRPHVNPIWVGEKQTLEVTYLGLPGGYFATEVLPMKRMGDREVYHFKGTVKSSAVASLIYRVDDMVESFWDSQGLFSHRFHMALDETKQVRDVLELYDSEKKKVFYWNRRNQPNKESTESKEYFDMPAFVQDSFSAIFYVRTLPLVEGEVYTFPVVSEGKGWDCVVTVIRHEMVDSPMGRIRTIVIRPQTRYNGVLKQEQGDSFIWLTDDDRRLVVRLEAKVKIGYVAAQLKKVELGEPPTAQ